jgi:hypothetical protein
VSFTSFMTLMGWSPASWDRGCVGSSKLSHFGASLRPLFAPMEARIESALLPPLKICSWDCGRVLRGEEVTLEGRLNQPSSSEAAERSRGLSSGSADSDGGPVVVVVGFGAF